jgi:hypothetical protein
MTGRSGTYEDFKHTALMDSKLKAHKIRQQLVSGNRHKRRAAKAQKKKK